MSDDRAITEEMKAVGKRVAELVDGKDPEDVAAILDHALLRWGIARDESDLRIAMEYLKERVQETINSA